MEILLSMKDIAEGWKRTYVEKQGEQEDNCSSLAWKTLRIAQASL